MLLCNLSRHTIHLSDGDNHYVLPYHGIEYEFPKLLLDLHNRHQYDHIVVINWPGAFTTLRVWCLTVNMLSHIYPHIKIYSISKTSIHHLLSSNHYLPAVWYMYIGQTKNIWKYSHQQQEKVWLDQCQYSLSINEDCWYDEWISDICPDTIIPHTQLIRITSESDNFTILYNNKNYHIQWSQMHTYLVDKLIPEYMIQPTGI